MKSLRLLQVLAGISGVLLAAAWSQAGEGVNLTAAGLQSWKTDQGEWQDVGGVSTDPANPAKLVSTKGTGVLVNGPNGRTVNLVSNLEHGDVRAHIEFVVPKGSNSGVYFQGRYEIQVLDSWGVEKPKYSDCGGIYQRWDPARGKGKEGYEGHAPKVNASLAPGEWQTFDVVFRAPKFDDQGKKIANARFEKVIHNGKVIHENVELTGPTRGAVSEDETATGTLLLQGDHGPVAYRNFRIERLDD